MPAPKFLSGLPKPVLFGLYGAIGGLLGALIFGELLWWLLKPPAAPEAPPQLAVSASATVQVYPNSVNTFTVRIVRERFDAPVTVKFGKLPASLSIPPITIPAGKAEAQATVTTTAGALSGEIKATLTAATEDGTPTASGEFQVVVVPTPPPPPGLAVAVPPNLAVFRRGTGKFIASIARRNYDGPILISVGPLPAGVTAAPAVIEADKSDAEVTLTADATSVVGPAKLTVTAAAPGHVELRQEAATELTVQNPPVAPVDVVFVLDVTASMQWAIDDLKNGIGKFADTLSKNQINFRLGLVTFQDLAITGEGIEVIQFPNGKKEEPFTSSAATFRDKVGQLRARGGGDIPESSLDAVAEAAKLPYRQGATRILLLITDAPPKIGRVSVANATNAVKEAEIDSVHLVIQRFDLDTYKPLMAAGSGKDGGKYFNLGDVVRGEEGFDGLLDTFGKAVTAAAIARNPDAKPVVAPPPDPPRLAAAAAAAPKAAEAAPAPTVPSLQSTERAAAGSEGQLVLQSGVWAGVIAALVCLVLLAGQHHYLRGSLPAIGGMAVGLLGGLGVGVIGGAAGQGLYTAAQKYPALAVASQVAGWALLGGLAGMGLSVFIPNMKPLLGLVGGAIGGAVGCAGFIAVSDAAGDLVGRLVGGLLLGLCIGLMVAVAEAAFRRAWLEVRFGARETITVNLGPEPVKIGGDAKACTVWARGAAPIALRFFLRDGKVICDDAVMRRESTVADGFAKEVGNVTVTVRTGSGTPSAPTPPRPASPPPSTPAKASAPLSLDDDFDLPMPISPPSAPKPVSPSPPPPAPVLRGSAPQTAVPAPKPVAPPAPMASPKPASPPVPPKPAPPAPTVPQAGAKPAVPPRPAAPPAPKPASPPPPATAAPKPPAGAKHPDACPSCGRVNPGKPRQRYCMVCDSTY